MRLGSVAAAGLAALVASSCGSVSEVPPAAGSASQTGTSGPTGPGTSNGTSGSDSATDASASSTSPGSNSQGSDSASASGGSSGATTGGEPFEGGYRKPITVPTGTVSGDITGFVMVVDIDDDPDLRDTASGGHVASNDGSDLGFRNGSGVALGFEVIEFDAASGSLLAWVHTPPLSAQADMTVYLHYGDPDAIFDGGGPWSDYLAVYHFEDDLSAATIRDSGPNGADGTHSGLGPGDTTAGMVGSGIDFGVADGGIVVDDAALDVPGPLAISAWGKMEGDTVAGFQRIYQHASPGVRYAELYVEDSVLTLGQVNVRANYLDPTTYAEIESVPGSFSMNTWHHYVAVFDNDGGELRLFFDGQLQATVPWTPPLSTGSTTTYLGNWGFQADSREWVGDLDEIHVRAFAPDVAWAGASFDNQNDPGGFYVVGPEETP